MSPNEYTGASQPAKSSSNELVVMVTAIYTFFNYLAEKKVNDSEVIKTCVPEEHLRPNSKQRLQMSPVLRWRLKTDKNILN